MSFVTTQPEMLAAAVAHLQSIGSAMSVQNAAAAAPITGVVPAAADEVSALTAARLDEPIRIMVFCDSCGWEARARRQLQRHRSRSGSFRGATPRGATTASFPQVQCD